MSQFRNDFATPAERRACRGDRSQRSPGSPAAACAGRSSRPDRGPADRSTASGPLLRHPAEPRAAARPRGRPDGAGRRLSDDHRPGQPCLPAQGRRGTAVRLPGRGHRSGPRNDLRPFPGRSAQPAAAALPEPGQRRRALTQPDGQGRDGRRRAVVDVGPHVHLPRPSGRRHPLLQGHGSPGRQGSAAAPRAGPPHRPPLQPPLQPGRGAVPRACRAAQRRAGAAGHRRAEDEQEPRQRDPHQRHRRRDRAPDRHCEDRRRSPHHLRPAAETRGLEPGAARRALRGSPTRRHRVRDRLRRQPRTQAPDHGSRQRALPRNPHAPNRSDSRPGLPAPDPPRRNHPGPRDRRDHPPRRPPSHAHRLPGHPRRVMALRPGAGRSVLRCGYGQVALAARATWPCRRRPGAGRPFSNRVRHALKRPARL